MAKKQTDERAALVKQFLAAGQTRREANAHAVKVLAERDRIIVNEDGTERPDEPGAPL